MPEGTYLTTTETTLTANEAAVAGAIAGGMLGVIMVCGLAFWILTIIACWKIFEKAGEKGWKSIIPIYNYYILFKIVNMKNWFWWLLGLGVIGSIVMSINSTCTEAANGAMTCAYNMNAATIITMMVLCVAGIWGGILYAWRTSKVFSHGIGFCIGLILLPNIFQLILGFGKSKYNKKNLKKA